MPNDASVQNLLKRLFQGRARIALMLYALQEEKERKVVCGPVKKIRASRQYVYWMLNRGCSLSVRLSLVFLLMQRSYSPFRFSPQNHLII